MLAVVDCYMTVASPFFTQNDGISCCSCVNVGNPFLMAVDAFSMPRFGGNKSD